LARWEQYGKRRNKEEERKREKQLIGLTLTGLLMEGLTLTGLLMEGLTLTGLLMEGVWNSCSQLHRRSDLK
jgi:hypothetical protein